MPDSPPPAERYKRPESVLVVVHTGDGLVLLMRRVSPARFWQSVTGSMEWHETDPLDTVRRELREETGLDSDSPGCALIDRRVSRRFPIKPAWRGRFAPGVRFNLEHVFTLRLPAPCEVTLDPAEHLEYGWLPRAEALERVTSYTNRDAIEAFVPAG